MFLMASVGIRPCAFHAHAHAHAGSPLTFFAASLKSNSKSESVLSKPLREPMNRLCDFSKYQDDVSDDDIPRRIAAASFIEIPRNLFTSSIAINVAKSFVKGWAQIQTKLTVATAPLNRVVKLFSIDSGSNSKLGQYGLSLACPTASLREGL